MEPDCILVWALLQEVTPTLPYLITGYDGQAGLTPGAFLRPPNPFDALDERTRHEERVSCAQGLIPSPFLRGGADQPKMGHRPRRACHASAAAS
jgi:hypothetical protein